LLVAPASSRQGGISVRDPRVPARLLVHSMRPRPAIPPGPAPPARVEERAGVTGFYRFVSKDYAVVSAAAPYAEVLQKLMEAAEPSRPLYVVDENGQLVGVIQPDLAHLPHLSTVPLDLATAADLAQPVQALGASSPEHDALCRLSEARGLRCLSSRRKPDASSALWS
jgi:hypothetical protein